MSALSNLSTWLRRFYDRLSAPAVILGDKGSRWFEHAKCSKFGTTCEFKSLKLPIGLTTLEDRVTPAAPYFQGFETDTGGWSVGANRVASGTNGVTSLQGAFHGQDLTPTAGDAFNNWGGYSSVFPAGGYRTIVYVHLDMATASPNDTRFDFSSAINNTGGTFRRDFVFNA